MEFKHINKMSHAYLAKHGITDYKGHWHERRLKQLQ